MNRTTHRPIIHKKPPVDEVDAITAREVLGMVLMQAKRPNTMNPHFLCSNEEFRAEIRATADRWVEHIRAQEREARANRDRMNGRAP